MSAQLPTYFLMVVFAGWLNRQQQAAIEYLKTENEILKSQLKVRPRLKDEVRRRLAEKCAGPEVVGRSGVHRDAGNDSRVASSTGRAEMDVSSRWGRASANLRHD
jgi:hypothetical protein